MSTRRPVKANRKRRHQNKNNKIQEVVPVSSGRKSSASKDSRKRKRYIPLKRDELIMKKQTMKSNELLYSLSGGVVGSSIKYIMYPLLLLRHCIFRTKKVSAKLAIKEIAENLKDSNLRGQKNKKEEKIKMTIQDEGFNMKDSDLMNSDLMDSDLMDSDLKDQKKEETVVVVEKKEKAETKAEAKEEVVVVEEGEDEVVVVKKEGEEVIVQEEGEGEEKKIVVEEEEEKENSSQSGTENASSCDDSNEIYSSSNEGSGIIGKEDTDTSEDVWCTAITKLLRNVSIDTDRSTSFTTSEELMEISMEECSNEKSQIEMKTTPKICGCQCYIDSEDSSSSLNEEVANDSSSSEDDFLPPQSRNVKHDKAIKNDFLYYGKKTPFVYKKRKVSFTEDEPNNKQNISSKSKRRPPVKSQYRKRRNIEYKEMATQTTDVEILPVTTKPKRRFCRKQADYRSLRTRSQNKKAEQELDYAADTEESSEEFAMSTPTERSSDSSILSSLTNSDSNDHESFQLRPWRAPNTINGLFVSSRAPPGFPIIPQYPPLFPNDAVPPAPTPLRHLYYEYPEFMDIPQPVQRSTGLDILNSNY